MQKVIGDSILEERNMVFFFLFLIPEISITVEGLNE